MWWRERQFRRTQDDLAQATAEADPKMLEEADQLVASAIIAGKSYKDALFETMMTFIELATGHVERGYEAHFERELAIAAVLAVRLRIIAEAKALR